MQDRPDKATLMDAVAEFLTEEVRPQIADKALSFRCLITANLASIVAREIRTEHNHNAAQMRRLSALLPEVDLSATQEAETTDRHAAIRALNHALVAKIKAGDFDERQQAAVWSHVNETLREKLSVINPRFVTTPDIS